jgi:protein-S-isoprenylcysteine O-methyltransferase Ste14
MNVIGKETAKRVAKHLGVLVLLLALASLVAFFAPMSVDPQIVFAAAFVIFLMWLGLTIFVGGQNGQ